MNARLELVHTEDDAPIPKPSLGPARPAEVSPLLVIAIAAGIVVGLLTAVLADHRLGRDRGRGRRARRPARAGRGRR